jgi:regulation of enolase protein 1 (concanavalin A-like superfamily)
MFDKWLNQPDTFTIHGNQITIHAPHKTDFFEDPLSDYSMSNAPLLYTRISGDFTFSCSITPEFKSIYDAGAVLLYADITHWIKFAFENTDLGYTAVVSVVTNNKSDDCNGEKIESKSLALKISRKKNVVGLYYSPNSSDWKMARLLTFPHASQKDNLLGISAQSPMGNGCRVTFKNFDFKKTPINDFRKGI